MSLRDSVWDAALEQLVKTGKFRIRDLPFEESELTTVRRVAREMEGFDWLARTSPSSPIWRAGPKAEVLMNLSDFKIQLARAKQPPEVSTSE
ncbi:hypothetical protein PM035_12900 [Halorubrum ezzemoulense]|uniref:hypothetical protein n=1 Tax=Halorubrum ezzemoulense TaxID=337243 RepID=UPI00232ED7C7|nr:hypothetical protein [Halorubrum ezzemoulense]MDB2261824.1 hypothetical protein [Halorubrum ezzemoulense]MDB2268586.1 hypothetical protein [Halorubrum ezzemoulense]